MKVMKMIMVAVVCLSSFNVAYAKKGGGGKAWKTQAVKVKLGKIKNPCVRRQYIMKVKKAYRQDNRK